jgi:hypothetical protein
MNWDYNLMSHGKGGIGLMSLEFAKGPRFMGLSKLSPGYACNGEFLLL